MLKQNRQERRRDRLQQAFRAWVFAESTQLRPEFYDWLLAERNISIDEALRWSQAGKSEIARDHQWADNWLAWQLDRLAAQNDVRFHKRQIREFRIWLKTLSGETLARVFQSLIEFTELAELDFWMLLENLEASKTPELQQIEQALLLHLTALWKISQVSEAIQEHNRWQTWVNRLSEKQSRAYDESVFHKLAERKLVPVPPADLWTNPETEATYLAQIDKVISKHNNEFRAILKEVWLEMSAET